MEVIVPIPAGISSGTVNGPALSNEVGPVVFDLSHTLCPVPTPPGSCVFNDVVSLSKAEVSELVAGHFYVNLASSAYPAGEIRGQIILSPATVGYYCPCAFTWRSHHEYLSCVRDAASALLEARFLSREQARVIVKDAAESDCGKSHYRKSRFR